MHHRQPQSTPDLWLLIRDFILASAAAVACDTACVRSTQLCTQRLWAAMAVRRNRGGGAAGVMAAGVVGVRVVVVELGLLDDASGRVPARWR